MFPGSSERVSKDNDYTYSYSTTTNSYPIKLELVHLLPRLTIVAMQRSCDFNSVLFTRTLKFCNHAITCSSY